MRTKDLCTKLLPIFNKYREIKLVYLFGSRAQNNFGPLSDYDFAIYINEREKKKIFDIKLELLSKINKVLKTDKIDVVIINKLKEPELKYNIIKEGKLIFEKEPFKILVEPKILNEYFDFHNMLLRYNLTKA